MKKSYLEMVVDVLIMTSSVVTSTFTPTSFFISLYNIIYIYLSFSPQCEIPQSAKVVSFCCFFRQCLGGYKMKGAGHPIKKTRWGESVGGCWFWKLFNFESTSALSDCWGGTCFQDLG